LGLELGFSPASNPAAKRPPPCRRLERSPKGEAIDLIAFVFVLVFFFKNNPEIACQASKPPNSIKQNKIELAF
jgi:hypothetical protein